MHAIYIAVRLQNKYQLKIQSQSVKNASPFQTRPTVVRDHRADREAVGPVVREPQMPSEIGTPGSCGIIGRLSILNYLGCAGASDAIGNFGQRSRGTVMLRSKATQFQKMN